MIVKEVDERFVLICDGDLRKVEHPKIKSRKHLQFTNMKSEPISTILTSGQMPGNHMIRNDMKRILKTEEFMGKEV